MFYCNGRVFIWEKRKVDIKKRKEKKKIVERKVYGMTNVKHPTNVSVARVYLKLMFSSDTTHTRREREKC